MASEKLDLEWVVEQLDYFENQARDIAEEAYNCKKVVEKIIKEEGGRDEN